MCCCVELDAERLMLVCCSAEYPTVQRSVHSTAYFPHYSDGSGCIRCTRPPYADSSVRYELPQHSTRLKLRSPYIVSTLSINAFVHRRFKASYRIVVEGQQHCSAQRNLSSNDSRISALALPHSQSNRITTPPPPLIDRLRIPHVIAC